MPPGSVVKREVKPSEPPQSVPQFEQPTPEHSHVEANGDGASGNGGGKTSMDAFEKEFLRKKQRELEAARMAGGGGTHVEQRHVGDQVGRNDPCPCGSGKKFKKCHGVEAS
jgi:uncharacterized protein YchJ